MSRFNLSFLEFVVKSRSGVSLKCNLPPTKTPNAKAAAISVGIK